MNVKDTTNCINSNDRLVDCVLKCKKRNAVFYAKGSESYKSSYKDCKNWRGIKLLSIQGKVFNRILL